MNHQHIIKDYQHVSETPSNTSFDYHHRSAISLTPGRYRDVGFYNDHKNIESNKRREMEGKHLQESSAFFERSGILSYTQKVQRLNHFNRKGPSLCPSISQHAKHELDFNQYVGHNHAYKQKYPGGSLAHEESFSREMFADTNDYSLTSIRKTWKKTPNEISGQPHPITWTNRLRVQPTSRERSSVHCGPSWKQIDQEDCRQKLNISDRNLKECKSSHNPAFMTGMMDHEISNTQGWETEMKLLSDKNPNNLAIPVNCKPNETDHLVKTIKSDEKLPHDMEEISGTSKTTIKYNSKNTNDEELCCMFTDKEQKECRYNKIAKLADILNVKIKEIRDECTNERALSSNVVNEKDADYGTKLNIRNTLTDVPRSSGKNIKSDGTSYAGNENKPLKANLSGIIVKRKSCENIDDSMLAGSDPSFSTRKGNMTEKHSFDFQPANEKLQESKIRFSKGRETKRKISDKLKELELKMIEDFEEHTVNEPSISKQNNQAVESREADGLNSVKHHKESNSMKSSIHGDSYSVTKEEPNISDKLLQGSEIKSKTLKNHKRVSFGNVSYRLIEPRPKSAVHSNQNLVLSQKIDKTSKGTVKTINEPKQMEILKVKDKLMKEALKKCPLGCSKTAPHSAEIKQKAQELFQKNLKKSERIAVHKRQKTLLPFISENKKGEANLKTFKIPKIHQTNRNEHKPITNHAVTKQVISENKDTSNECELFEEVKEIVKAEKMEKIIDANKSSRNSKTAQVKPTIGIGSFVAEKSESNCDTDRVLNESLKKRTQIKQLASEKKNLSSSYKVLEEVPKTQHDVKKKLPSVNRPSSDFRTAQVRTARKQISSAAAKSEANFHSESVSGNSLKKHTEGKLMVPGNNKLSKGCELADEKTKILKVEKTKRQINMTKSSSNFKTTQDKPAVSTAGEKYGVNLATESKLNKKFKDLPKTKKVRIENKQLLSGRKVTRSVEVEETKIVTNKLPGDDKIRHVKQAVGITSLGAEKSKANLHSDSVSLKQLKKHTETKEVVSKIKKLSECCEVAEERTNAVKVEKTNKQQRNVKKPSGNSERAQVSPAASSEAKYEVTYDTDSISCKPLKEQTETRQMKSDSKKVSKDCEVDKKVTETEKAAKAKKLENDNKTSNDFKTVQFKPDVGIVSTAAANSESNCDTDSISCSLETEKLIEDSLSVFYHGASKRDSSSKRKNVFEFDMPKNCKAYNTNRSLDTEWVGTASKVLSNNNMTGKEKSTAYKPADIPIEIVNTSEAVNMQESYHHQNLEAPNLLSLFLKQGQNNELCAKNSEKARQSENFPIDRNQTHKLSCINQSTSNGNSLQQASAKTNFNSNDKKIFNASDETRSLKLQWSLKERKGTNVQAKKSTTKGDKVIFPRKSICGSNVHAVETSHNKPDKSKHNTSVLCPDSVGLNKKLDLNLKQNSDSNHRKEDSFLGKRDNRKEKQELLMKDLKAQTSEYTTAVVADQYRSSHGQSRTWNCKSLAYSMANRPDCQNNESVLTTTTALKVQVPGFDVPSSKQSSKTLSTQMHYPLNLQQVSCQPQIAINSSSMDHYSNKMSPFMCKMQTSNALKSQNPCLGREGRASAVYDRQSNSALDSCKLSCTYNPVTTAAYLDTFQGKLKPSNTEKAKTNSAAPYISYLANNLPSYKLYSEVGGSFGPVANPAFCRPVPSYEPQMTDVHSHQNHQTCMLSSHMVQGITGIDHYTFSAANTPIISQPTNKIYAGQDCLNTDLSSNQTGSSGFSGVNHGFSFPVYGMIDAKNSHHQISRLKSWESSKSCQYDGFNAQQRTGSGALYNHILERNQFVCDYFGNENLGWGRRNISSGYINQMQATRSYFQTYPLANYPQTQSVMEPSQEMETLQQHNSSFDSIGAFGIGNSHNEEFSSNEQHTNPHFSLINSFRSPEYVRTPTLQYPQEHTQLDCYKNNSNPAKLMQDSGSIPDRQRSLVVPNTTNTKNYNLEQNEMNYVKTCQVQEASTSNTQSSHLDLDFERFCEEMKSVSSSELTELMNYILSDSDNGSDTTCDKIANRSPPVLSPAVEKRLVNPISHIVNETSVARISKTVNNLIDECKHKLAEDIIEGTSLVPRKKCNNLSVQSDTASTAEQCETVVLATDIKASYQTTEYGSDSENPNSKISCGIEDECITTSTEAQVLGSGKETVQVKVNGVVAVHEINEQKVAAEASNNTSSNRYNSVKSSESSVTKDERAAESNTGIANLDVKGLDNLEIENMKTSACENDSLTAADRSPKRFGSDNIASNKTCSNVAVEGISQKVISSENVTNNHKGESNIPGSDAERQSDTINSTDLNLETNEVNSVVENTISTKTNHYVQTEYEKDSLKTVNNISSHKKRKPTSENHLYDSAAAFLGTNFDQEIPRKRRRPQSLHTDIEKEHLVGLRTRKRSYDNQKANKELQLKKKLKLGAHRGQNKKEENKKADRGQNKSEETKKADISQKKNEENNKKGEATGISQDCKSRKATKDCKSKEEGQQAVSSELHVQKKRGRKSKRSERKIAERGPDLNKTKVRSVSLEHAGTKGKVMEDKSSQKDKWAPELKVALTDIMGKKNTLTKSRRKPSKKSKSTSGHSSHHEDKRYITNRNEINKKHQKYCEKRKTEAVKDCHKKRKTDKLDTKSAIETVGTSQLTVVKSSLTKNKLVSSTNTVPNLEKELKCSLCEVKVQPSELWAHLKIAHPRHCDVCYLKFPSKVSVFWAFVYHIRHGLSSSKMTPNI